MINRDIRKAETLPSSYYKSDEDFERSKELIFSKSWQLIGDNDLVKFPKDVYPFTFLENFLDEPLLLTRNEEDKIQCLSNVCTHRGNLLIANPGKLNKLICGYHGRRFSLDGKMESMPEFQEVESFPRPCDHLQKISLVPFHHLLFASIDPSYDLSSTVDVLNRKVGFLRWNEMRFASEKSRDYLVNAHWALYCDNYLEGFHIPFVHKDLNASLDYSTYETVIYDYCNLQIGYSNDGTQSFNLPESHEDFGKEVAAYYFWLFPNTMLNFYPWGLSINIVKPLKKNLSKVTYLTYILDDSKIDNSAGALLDKVEREDEDIVESVQKGISSSFYSTGRFSATREKGVHHFHSLIDQFLFS